jgi:hypothetical protein
MRIDDRSYLDTSLQVSGGLVCSLFYPKRYSQRCKDECVKYEKVQQETAGFQNFDLE